jgi:hypothetical protein
MLIVTEELSGFAAIFASYWPQSEPDEKAGAEGAEVETARSPAEVQPKLPMITPSAQIA